MNNPPSRDSILAKVQELAMDLVKLPADQVQPSSRLREDLDVDSLFMTQFILTLEDDFEIETDDMDSVHFVTIDSTTDYVMEKLRDK